MKQQWSVASREMICRNCNERYDKGFYCTTCSNIKEVYAIWESFCEYQVDEENIMLKKERSGLLKNWKVGEHYDLVVLCEVIDKHDSTREIYAWYNQ